jgi:hypothetical protein
MSRWLATHGSYPELRCETSSRQPGLRAIWVGFEPVSPIDATQLIHSATRQKRQNGQISRIEVHAGYTAERMPRPFVFSGKKKDWCDDSKAREGHFSVRRFSSRAAVSTAAKSGRMCVKYYVARQIRFCGDERYVVLT